MYFANFRKYPVVNFCGLLLFFRIDLTKYCIVGYLLHQRMELERERFFQLKGTGGQIRSSGGVTFAKVVFW